MSDTMYLLTGTYTSGSSEGIYVYRFNQITGVFGLVSRVKVENPSYMAVADNSYVYAVTENRDTSACVNAFAFNREKGSLILLNHEETKGASPCYIAVDKNRCFVVTANYRDGSISVLGIKATVPYLRLNRSFRFTGAARIRAGKNRLICTVSDFHRMERLCMPPIWEQIVSTG